MPSGSTWNERGQTFSPHCRPAISQHGNKHILQKASGEQFVEGLLLKEPRMNTVTVLVEGYIKAIEGRQLIPGVAADGARHVAGTIVLIHGRSQGVATLLGSKTIQVAPSGLPSVTGSLVIAPLIGLIVLTTNRSCSRSVLPWQR